MPVIKKKYIKFTDYANQKIDQLFDEQQLAKAVVHRAYTGQSALLLNDGKGRLTWMALPVEAQFSPVCGVELADVDQDGRTDLLLAGNFFDVQPEIGRYDAGHGLVLRGLGKTPAGRLAFEALLPRQSGFYINGQVRHLRRLAQGGLVAAKNSDAVQVFALPGARPLPSPPLARN